MIDSNTVALMAFFWLIGWGIACGQHHSDCEKTGEKKKITAFLVLALMWPHFLGYSK